MIIYYIVKKIKDYMNSIMKDEMHYEINNQML